MTGNITFPVQLELRIDWSELDLFGHVNNVAFFKYIQASRVNYWDLIGLSKMFHETRVGPMLVSAGCNFKRPLFYPEKIIVQARMDFIRNTSFGFLHRLLNEKGEIAAEAKDVMVMYDFNKEEKVPFPEALRLEAEKLEGRKF